MHHAFSHRGFAQLLEVIRSLQSLAMAGAEMGSDGGCVLVVPATAGEARRLVVGVPLHWSISLFQFRCASEKIHQLCEPYQRDHVLVAKQGLQELCPVHVKAGRIVFRPGLVGLL